MASKKDYTVAHNTPEVEIVGTVARGEFFKKLAPTLGVKKESLANAFEGLTTSIKGVEQLEDLILSVGDEVLNAVPKKALRSEKVQALVFDTEGHEDQLDLLDDLDEDDGEDAYTPDVGNDGDYAVSQEKLKFPKFVSYFWKLVQTEGRGRAQFLLETTLVTMGIHYLLYVSRALDPDALKDASIVIALPDFYRDLLVADGETIFDRFKGVGAVREHVSERVAAEMPDSDEAFILRLIQLARKNLERAMEDGSVEYREVSAFSRGMLQVNEVETLASTILDGCPVAKKRK